MEQVQNAGKTESPAEAWGKAVLRAYDVNGSDSLTKDESTLSAEAFEKLDTDQNGELTALELSKGYEDYANSIE